MELLDYRIQFDGDTCVAETANESSPIGALAVVPSEGKRGRIFMRNGVKFCEGIQDQVRWLVGELNGVRTYFDGTNLVMTTEDLYP